MVEVSVQAVKDRIDRGEQIYMLDVRELHEYLEKNNGAHHIPLGKLQLFELDDIKVDKHDEIICLCRSGKRSMLACLILEQVGYTDVKNLKGGMDAW